MRSAKEAARGLVRWAAAGRDALRRPSGDVTVLIYHRVGARTPVPVDLPTGLFADQIAMVAGRAIDLDTALATLEGPADPASADGPAVVVTFDDGTADVVEEAVPVLVEHGVPALLYLATDFIESQRPFPDDGKVPSWSALADAVSTGFLQVGSHTHTHLLLDRVDARTAAEDLDRSVDLIGERLGVTARHFAYPKALPARGATDRAVRERFASAAVAGTRANVVGATDPWALARTPVQVADGTRWFARKVAGGMGLEDDLRTALGRVRHRRAVT